MHHTSSFRCRSRQQEKQEPDAEAVGAIMPPPIPHGYNILEDPCMLFESGDEWATLAEHTGTGEVGLLVYDRQQARGFTDAEKSILLFAYQLQHATTIINSLSEAFKHEYAEEVGMLRSAWWCVEDEEARALVALLGPVPKEDKDTQEPAGAEAEGEVQA
ncbi:hypothetical protein [Ktedonobacter racemifer]|uniref:Uncharacterized protein n=1 Tax=Ktedonobacter racemifer DSM 44963 TaxID=485913 RepID=D6U8S9_KTERA|nr:hypothetical protein [Ktedonobacter racemifer]EFH79639.1 hypothetical protein Krac_0117 [Ktedonobacter racemifer DSM 44963]